MAEMGSFPCHVSLRLSLFSPSRVNMPSENPPAAPDSVLRGRLWIRLRRPHLGDSKCRLAIALWFWVVPSGKQPHSELENHHVYPFLMGKLTINGHFSIAMLVYQRVYLHISYCWLFAIPCSILYFHLFSQAMGLPGTAPGTAAPGTRELLGTPDQTSPNHSGIMGESCDEDAMQLWVKSCKILGQQPSGPSLDRRRGCCLGGLSCCKGWCFQTWRISKFFAAIFPVVQVDNQRTFHTDLWLVVKTRGQTSSQLRIIVLNWKYLWYLKPPAGHTHRL